MMEQTRLAPKSNELTPPKWRESTRNKITPPLRSTPGEAITPTPFHHERKKNVQFQEPIVNTGQVGNKGVYDPILITPKHYYNPSSSEGHPDPDKQDSPVGHSNQNGRYFSGTVENGRSGDFCGYYFPSISGLTSEFSENRKVHPTSTPGWDYNQTPLNSRYENVLEPRNLSL